MDMPQATINVRVDAELKEQFSKLADELGLSVSAAINVFLKAAVNHRGIPFELKCKDADGFDEYEPLSYDMLNAESKAAVEEAEYILAHPNDPAYPRYDSTEEMFKANGWL